MTLMLGQGLNSLDYKEHIDYDVVVSTNPAFNKAIVRINVFKHHRQVRDQSAPPLQHNGQMCPRRSKHLSSKPLPPEPALLNMTDH